MSFGERLYPDIVRDLLTLLTGGTVAETFIYEKGRDTYLLQNVPVKRVSFLESEIQSGKDKVRYRFTDRDFQLVGSDDRATELTSVRFRRDGKRPDAGGIVHVNYYPSRLKNTPLTDVNVGSVARTLLETVAWEMAAQYQQLGRVYRSGFVDTAEGLSLERVAALLDVQRLQADHPIGRVRFIRRVGSPGDIFIPINTAVSDGKGARYLTSQDGQMLPSQSTLEVWVRGEALRTKLVGAGELAVLERAIAGVDRVVNDEATFRAADDERDDQFAARSKRAIHATGRGTRDAIQYAIQNLPFVQAVTITEPDEAPAGTMPPGSLRIVVALNDDNAVRRNQVQQAVRDYRPAGISVDLAFAGKLELGFKLTLILKGSSLPASAITEVTDGVKQRLGALAAGLGPGATLRRAQVVAVLMSDARVVDAQVSITTDGSTVSADAYLLPGDRASHLDPKAVVVDKIKFETEPAEGTRTVHVDAELSLTITQDDIADVATLEPDVRAALKPLLDKKQGPGATLSFADVLDALRPSTRFVTAAARSALALVEDSGAFTDLRDGDPPWPVPAGATLTLRNVTLTEDKGE